MEDSTNTGTVNSTATGAEDNTNTGAVIDGRYLLVEFQDSNGNVCYFHTDARVVWLPDGASLYDFLNSDISDEQINSIFNKEEEVVGP